MHLCYKYTSYPTFYCRGLVQVVQKCENTGRSHLCYKAANFVQNSLEAAAIFVLLLNFNT